jgi:hypothetical protein
MPEEKRERIIDRIGNGKIIDKIFGQRLTTENLSDEQKQLASAFRDGIAEALGVPPENIKESAVMNWILNFTRAFVKPEHFDETVQPPVRMIRSFGQQLGQLVRESIEKLDKEEKIDKQVDQKPVEQKTERVVDTVKKRVKEFRSTIAIDSN